MKGYVEISPEDDESVEVYENLNSLIPEEDTSNHRISRLIGEDESQPTCKVTLIKDNKPIKITTTADGRTDEILRVICPDPEKYQMPTIWEVPCEA